jgi:hypothetical protein
MRRLTVAVLAATALLSTGCSSDITSAALQSSVGTAFQRLYVLQQHELGRDEPVTPDAGAQCLRSGSAARTGAGTWTCTVHFPYADGHLVPLSFDVEVQPIGCYVASGPPAIVGGLTLTTPAGASVTNPLYAFDGCFDPQ